MIDPSMLPDDVTGWIDAIRCARQVLGLALDLLRGLRAVWALRRDSRPEAHREKDRVNEQRVSRSVDQ